MDNFIDKFAQRKNAQEMIKANAMAEAEEKEKLTVKLSEYEMAIQEMRRCNLLNLENSEKIKELLAASLRKIEEVQKKDAESDEEAGKAVEEVKSLLEALKGQVAELLKEQQVQISGILEEQQSRLDEFLTEQKAQQKAIEECLHAAEEFNHKEAVKVYRNVQAVIERALPKQTEEIGGMIKKVEEKRGTSVGMIVIGVLTFAAAAANTVIEVLRILGRL